MTEEKSTKEQRDNGELSKDNMGGDHISRSLFISAVVIALLLGVFIGTFIHPSAQATQGSEQNDQSEPLAEAEEAAPQSWLPEAEEGDASAAEGADSDAEEYEGDPNQTIVENGMIIEKGVVQPGSAVITNITKLGVSTQDAQVMFNALDGIYDFKKAQPGDIFEIAFDQKSNVPVRFKYEASPTEIYTVKKNGDKYVGKQIDVETQKEIKVFAGTIQSSLFGTMQKLGARPALAAAMATVLSTQVDFLKEQRPGDTFRVMVEEESLDGEFMGYGPILALEYTGKKAGQRKLYRFHPKGDNPKYYDPKMISTPSSALTIPLFYTRMSSPFGSRMHPILKRRVMHNGTDFSAPTGTPVWACADGTISFIGPKGANGNLVSIKHDNGISSAYAHLVRFKSGLKKGDKVRRKQVIGYVGSTGRSTGPHLHWGIKKNGKWVDPLKFKVVPGRKVAAKYRDELAKVISTCSKAMSRVAIKP